MLVKETSRQARALCHTENKAWGSNPGLCIVILYHLSPREPFPGGPVVKDTPAKTRHRFASLVQEEPTGLGAAKPGRHSD